MATIMHVGIDNPQEWRKEILNTGVDAIQTLKAFEIHKKYNQEKSVYRKHFAQIIKELSTSIQEFRDMLPHIHTPHMPHEKPSGPKVKIKATVKIKKAPVRKKTHLDKLEDDISSLKDKIANL